MNNVFDDPAFGVVPLTDAINKLKFIPGRLGRLGLFSTSSISTTAVAIEERNGVLVLVAPTPRGGPGQTVEKAKRGLRMLAVPHFEINDAIMAEESQGVRAFGEESATEAVMDKVTERNQQHSQSMDATEEYARIGAVKGVITYADGTSTDLFTEFGVSQETEIDFDLDNNAPAAGVLRKKCAGIYRTMASNLEGVSFTGVRAECGDAFFDDLIAHKEIRETYLQQQEARDLRTGYVGAGADGVYGSFNFGGVIWENYRGAVGNTKFVDDNKVHFYPVGAPGLFRTVYAPADYNETVNTMGKRLYAKIYEMDNGKGYKLDVQMNALSYCTRPKVLMQGKRT